MRVLVALLISIGCLGMVACGGDESNESKYSGEEANVARVIDELSDAARDGDGARICEQLFTRNLNISVTRASRQSCANEVTENVFEEGAKYDVESLTLEGNRATVKVKDQEDRESDLLMVKQGGVWRIAKIV